MYDEPEELARVNTEGALGGVESHVVPSQRVESLGQVGQVSRRRATFYNHIVDVDLHVSPYLVSKHFVHSPLIRSPNVLQPEWHNLVEVYPSVGEEGDCAAGLRAPS